MKKDRNQIKTYEPDSVVLESIAPSYAFELFNNSGHTLTDLKIADVEFPEIYNMDRAIYESDVDLPKVPVTYTLLGKQVSGLLRKGKTTYAVSPTK